MVESIHNLVLYTPCFSSAGYGDQVIYVRGLRGEGRGVQHSRRKSENWVDGRMHDAAHSRAMLRPSADGSGKLRVAGARRSPVVPHD